MKNPPPIKLYPRTEQKARHTLAQHLSGGDLRKYVLLVRLPLFDVAMGGRAGK
jgi:hypothetical protein